MKTRIFLPIIAVLFAAFALPTPALAQTFLKNTNQSRKTRSVLSGGSGNLIGSNSTTSFLGGGEANEIAPNTAYSLIGGGQYNRVYDSWATVVGGSGNAAYGSCSVVVGGLNNTASNSTSTVGGGYENRALTNHATVAGGYYNTAGDAFATVSGGMSNEATGFYATVPGGARCKATNTGAFVWSGDENLFTVSTNNYSFTVRAAGGIRFITTLVDSATVTNGAYNFNNTNPALTNGVYLAPNSGSWASLSDSNAKTKVTAIKPREILSKLASMPVTEWEYKADPKRRYIGPMAQDFHAAFGLGSDDKTISTLDSDGVMYAAIQGLVEELKDRDKKHAEDLAERDVAMAERDAKIGKLGHELDAIREQLSKLPPVP